MSTQWNTCNTSHKPASTHRGPFVLTFTCSLVPIHNSPKLGYESEFFMSEQSTRHNQVLSSLIENEGEQSNLF